MFYHTLHPITLHSRLAAVEPDMKHVFTASLKLAGEAIDPFTVCKSKVMASIVEQEEI